MDEKGRLTAASLVAMSTALAGNNPFLNNLLTDELGANHLSWINLGDEKLQAGKRAIRRIRKRRERVQRAEVKAGKENAHRVRVARMREERRKDGFLRNLFLLP